MKRSIALLAGVAAAFVIAAHPVAAVPNAPANAPNSTAPASSPAATSVPADAVGLSLSQVEGAGLAVTLDPGTSEEHDLVVSNHTSNLRLTIKLSATDATGSLGTGPASWLAFGDDEIEIDPHVATTVPMTVAVPHDTQPGSALAHVTASVENAVSAADGSPVAGTASETFPVSITVQGTPTAQIAIADVHRDDQGSRHQLAIVLRNFGDQGAQVSGHVRVAGQVPQTLPFHADLAASSDTTVELDWKAPPAGTASDIAVDLEYGGGNVASWSSELGGAPTDLSPAPVTTATTSPGPASSAPTAGSTASPAKPWWKQTIVMLLAILLLLAAGIWFVFEMQSSRRRRETELAEPVRGVFPPGWAPASSEESIDLAKQLVRLTEVVVELVSAHREDQEWSDERPRARSPGVDPPERAAEPLGRSRLDPDDPGDARAGPAPPAAVATTESGPEPEPEPYELEVPVEPAYPASLTAGAVARPESHAEPVPEAVSEPAELVAEPAAELVTEPEPAAVEPVEPEPSEPAVVEPVEPPAEIAVDDPCAPLMARLVELDRERRRLRDWMDAEESGQAIEPSPDWYSFAAESGAGELDPNAQRADTPDGSS